MRPMGDARGGEPDVCQEMIAEGLFIEASATLEAAMPLFERADVAFLPVVTRSNTQPPELVGTLFHIDALKAYNRALAATAAEEHS